MPICAQEWQWCGTSGLRRGGRGRGWIVTLAENFLRPFFFPLRFVIIVGRHRAVGLHVGNDMLAGIGKEIATRPPNSLDIAFLFAGGGGSRRGLLQRG